MGRTSILMFPIYGMAVLLAPIAGAFDRVGGACGTVAGKLAGRKEPGKQKKSRTSAAKTVRHGVLYMCLIFMAEYASGAWLKEKNMCPWDYSQCRANIHGLIRLDFAPLWFADFSLNSSRKRRNTENQCQIALVFTPFILYNREGQGGDWI